MSPDNPKENFFFSIFLFVTRIWMARILIDGGQSILRFFSSQDLRDFFTEWFGDRLGFPFPLQMAFLAKSTEFFGGILICLGLFTRISAALAAVVMLVATLVANLNYSGEGDLIMTDGLVTIPTFLFACLLMFTGAGRISIDNAIQKKFFQHKTKWWLA